jgi:hypothetical protein
MEVDRAAGLVLGHLGVAHPDQPLDLGLTDAEQLGQSAVDGHAQGVPPQLRRERVPQRQARPVEAVVIQRPAEGVDLGFGVTVPAGDGAAVLALGLGIAESARHRIAMLGASVWTGPKDGAVKVTNSRGWAATVSGMPLPPRRPAAIRCQASRR